MGDREREKPSTPILETSVVANQRKTEETAGGGEELETDTEVGSTAEERDETHAIRAVEGQETSMPTEEPQRAADDDGLIMPSRGEYEEEGDDDESRHDAREDWWEEVAYEEAKTSGHEEKAREGSSTPAIETLAVSAIANMRPRVMGGGGEGTRATTDESAERGIREVAENEGLCARKSEHNITKDAGNRAGQEGREGVPRGETATSEVAEDTEAESTNTKVGECETCNTAA